MQTVEAIMKLNRIFKSKDWYSKDSNEYVFNNFCKLFDNLSDEQRELIIELTEHYCWIPSNEYEAKLIATLNQIESTKLKGLKKIYLFPIIDPKDEGDIKSGPFVLYLIKGQKRLLKEEYWSIDFDVLFKFSHLNSYNLDIQNYESLFIFDDYLGSGKTVNDCLKEIIDNNKNLNANNITIISLVAQNEICDLLKKRGFSVYNYFLSKKGISDHNKTPILEKKINIMLEMEKMILGDFSSLGFRQSEALVTMVRTPDNTFPIFRKRYKKGREVFDAPFLREDV